MRPIKKQIALLFLSAFFLFGNQFVISAQDINPGSSIFIFKSPRRPPSKMVSSGQTNSGSKPAGKPVPKPTPVKVKVNQPAGKKQQGQPVVKDEPIAPEDWINENADYAIEERKVSDSEPFLSLTNGFLNTRYQFCASPQFPNAARRAKKKLMQSKVIVTVAKYGGVLDAKAVEGDPEFRAAVYETLGSMRFRESYFTGEPVRIEGYLNFTQNPANEIVCNTAPQEVEIPTAIDGGDLTGQAKSCETPGFPAEAKVSGLKSVETKIQVVVGEDGKVSLAKFIEGNPSFGALAEKAAMQTVFWRSSITHKYVKVRGTLTYKQTPDNSIRCTTKVVTE